jgi:Mg2+-importing ATPase
MLYIGPISSIFDILTFLVLWHVFGADAPEHAPFFQAGWFMEGLLSQTLIVHMIRTARVPFVQSRAAWPVLIMTALVMGAGLLIPYSAFGRSLGFDGPPVHYLLFLVAILVAYTTLTQIVKTWYIRRFATWL